MIGVEFRADTGYTRLEDIGRGEGRNSTVWKVFDKRLGGEFAAKEMEKKDFMRGATEYYTEAQTMFASDHQNVVPIRCCCETPEIISIVMPFYKNGSLASRIKFAPLPLVDVISVGRQILMGVTKIHLASKLHLDIKPSNVLFGDNAAALVADFGQSCSIDASGIATPPPMYHFAMPPEVLQYYAVVAESDIYQVALTLYRAANGETLFASQKPGQSDLAVQVTSGAFPNRNLFLPHVPKRLRTVIRKGLSINPEDRYRTAQEFANELGKICMPLNWTASGDIAGRMEWKAERRGRPDFIITRYSDNGDWCVELWRQRNGKRTRFCKNAWRKFRSQAPADKYLKSLFEMQA